VGWRPRGAGRKYKNKRGHVTWNSPSSFLGTGLTYSVKIGQARCKRPKYRLSSVGLIGDALAFACEAGNQVGPR
jgi:hypothetical protein